jgi:hypothetical protein
MIHLVVQRFLHFTDLSLINVSFLGRLEVQS